MRLIETLKKWLLENADDQHYLFTSMDFRAIFPQISNASFRAILSKAVASGLLTRICKGVYLYKPTYHQDDCLLFRVVQALRGGNFNYISLETALSEYGVIANDNYKWLPAKTNYNWISIMSSGCGNKVSCGEFGTIEFIHTNQKPDDIKDHLIHHDKYGLWQADITLAISDMKRTRRNCDCIDWHKVRAIMS